MDYILITNDLRIAQEAEGVGVGTIMLDLEREGKSIRQSNRNSFISSHTLGELIPLRAVLSKSKLMVRVDPILTEKSISQIEESINLGADAIMLPMARTKSEVEKFVSIINGRAESQVLIETSSALVRTYEISEVSGLDVIHFGLNDLHIDLHLDFMFEVLASGILEFAARELSRKGIRFGIGGIGRIGGKNAIPPRLILDELLELGATQVILSRDFHTSFQTDSEKVKNSFTDEFGRLQNLLLDLKKSKGLKENKAREELRSAVRGVLKSGIV